jgi:signal transduction histidine kinase
MSEKIKVLYIDDEVQNLHSFKAAFRLDYTVLLAGSVSEAWRMLEENADICVVLCDQRMPERTGTELLEEIRNRFPLPVRMLITGYTDIESVIDAINRGNIFRYIKKPWLELDVHSAIEEGHNFYLTNTWLKAKNEALEKAYAELDKFSYSVTHDLRGPILSTLGVLDLAKSLDSLEEVRDILELIEKAMHKLDHFIENTHDYYKINRGEMQLSNINFDEVVQDLRDVYEMNGINTGIQFVTNVEQREPFRSDQVSLQIILNNLLSNGFKYQRRDDADKYVRLDITVDRGEAQFAVQDNGIGINPEYTDRIFDMFYRATSEATGSGFGLYNVKQAIQRLQGNIQVSSVPNEGTQFVVTIPTK